MKKLIYVVLVFITMFALNSCNKVENPLSEQSPVMQIDGQNTTYGLRMVVKEHRGSTTTVLIDESYGMIGYNFGIYTSFYTPYKPGDISYSVDCYLDWDGGGTSSWDVAQYEIWNSTKTYKPFSQFLSCNSNYSGSINYTWSANLERGQQYWVRMNTTVITDDDKVVND